MLTWRMEWIVVAVNYIHTATAFKDKINSGCNQWHFRGEVSLIPLPRTVCIVESNCGHRSAFASFAAALNWWWWVGQETEHGTAIHDTGFQVRGWKSIRPENIISHAAHNWNDCIHMCFLAFYPTLLLHPPILHISRLFLFICRRSGFSIYYCIVRWAYSV